MLQTREDELADILKGQSSLLQEAYSILEQEEKQDEVVQAAIRSNRKEQHNDLTGLDPARIFDLETIRRTCIKYRLRFLVSGRYKGEIPGAAVRAVRHLEAQAGKHVKGFMIMAPAERFQLSDCDTDPILFVPVGAGSYYMVHRWGRDMRPWRLALGWPLRDWPQFVALAFAASLLIGSLIPTAWVSAQAGAPWWGTYRLGAIFCTTMLVGAITSYTWWAFFGQFSKDAWNCKTFN